MKTHHDRTKNISQSWFAALAVSLLAVVTVSLESGKAGTAAEDETRVRQFVAAFNTRNIDAMLEMVDDNVQWLSIKEAKITIETDGKSALRESLVGYFRGCPSCKSSLVWVRKAGSRVTAMERATWSGKGGSKSQRGLSVYEFRDDKILRVYYFPADVDAPPEAVNH